MKKQIACIVAMTIFAAFILGFLGFAVWAAYKESMLWFPITVIGLWIGACTLLDYSNSKDAGKSE